MEVSFSPLLFLWFKLLASYDTNKKPQPASGCCCKLSQITADIRTIPCRFPEKKRRMTV